MQDFFALLVLAATVEAVWQVLKMTWQEGKIRVDTIGALVLGIFVCVAAGVDFLAMVGVPLQTPYAGAALSGILISRGASFVHDFLAGVERLRTGSGGSDKEV
jgi:hypothetical protein